MKEDEIWKEKEGEKGSEGEEEGGDEVCMEQEGEKGSLGEDEGRRDLDGLGRGEGEFI
jgi:hypothetical protein